MFITGLPAITPSCHIHHSHRGKPKVILPLVLKSLIQYRSDHKSLYALSRLTLSSPLMPFEHHLFSSFNPDDNSSSEPCRAKDGSPSGLILSNSLFAAKLNKTPLPLLLMPDFTKSVYGSIT